MVPRYGTVVFERRSRHKKRTEIELVEQSLNCILLGTAN